MEGGHSPRPAVPSPQGARKFNRGDVLERIRYILGEIGRAHV